MVSPCHSAAYTDRTYFGHTGWLLESWNWHSRRTTDVTVVDTWKRSLQLAYLREDFMSRGSLYMNLFQVTDTKIWRRSTVQLARILTVRLLALAS